MTELIVALDCDVKKAITLYDLLVPYVKTFKIRIPMLMQSNGRRVVTLIGREADLFLDLKVYDTVDSVQATINAAYSFNCKLITVHEDCITNIKDKHNLKVISVRRLTDGTGQQPYPLNTKADGFVTDVEQAKEIRPYTMGKIIITPGIRLPHQENNNHTYPSTPQQAKEAKVDYIVVGRPIVNDDNPIKATLQILDQIR